MKKNYYIELDLDDNDDISYEDKIDNSKIKKKFLLPSEKHRQKREKLKKISPYIKTFKYSGIISFIVLIYLFYNPILLFLSSILQSNPTYYYYFLFVENQISNNTILGLSFASILGSIFFLVLPSEALFIYFLSSTNYNFLLIIFIIVFGNLIGMTFNYLFGRILGKRTLKFLFKEKKFYDYQEKVENVGGYFLFFGNIFPGPIEVLSVFYGGFRYSFLRYLTLVFFGRLIKFSIIFIAFHFFWTDVSYYWVLFKTYFSFLF